MSDFTITYGGFIVENIRNSIIKDCLESGDAENYFLALLEVIGELEDRYYDGDLDFDTIQVH